MNLISKIEEKETKKLKLNFEKNFKVGDIISVDILYSLKKKKTQNFTGVVISIKKKNFNSSFTIRKNISGVWVEKQLLFYSPLIKNIKIKFKNKIKRSKLYNLRKKNK